MHTLTSIAGELNLNRKSVENAYTKAKAQYGVFGELVAEGNYQVRHFTDNEKELILEHLPQATRGSQPIKSSAIVPSEITSFEQLQKLEMSGGVRKVDSLALDLDQVSTVVLALVSKGKDQINQTRQENAEELQKVLETRKHLNRQLQELQELRTMAKVEEFVTATVTKSANTEISDILGKLTELLQ